MKINIEKLKEAKKNKNMTNKDIRNEIYQKW